MYVDGRFYDMDGQIDNEELEMKILREVEPYVSRSIAKKVQTLRNSLKYYARTERLPLHEDRIHFKNGLTYNKNVPGYNGRKVRGYNGVCRACGANPFSN